MMIKKENEAYKTISEVAEELNLVNLKSGKVSTHTLRFWEKEFKQIKPKIFAGNRRYYDIKTIEILKKIKYLLKDKGLTIKGVKKIFKHNKDIDLGIKNNIKNEYLKLNIKHKSKNILKKLSSLKKHG